MAALDPQLFLDSTITTILVGSEERKYHVHKQLLCQKLGYFKAAYRTTLKEALEDVFRIDDVPDAAFRTLIAWMYTGKVSLEPGREEALPEHEEVGEEGREAIGGDEEFQGNAEQDYNEEEYEACEGDVDYEYDSGSEADEDSGEELFISAAPWMLFTTPVTTRFEELKSQYEQIAVVGEPDEKDSEYDLVKEIFPYSAPTELDAFQLRVLVECYNYIPVYGEHLAKWKKMLVEKQAEEASDAEEEDVQSDTDTYDRLIDLYILTDRFDAPELGDTIISLLKAEQAAQTDLLHGQLLPAFPSVAKAFETLPTGAGLRKWLLEVFALHWLPSADTPEQKAERELLPRDFLMELMLATAERGYYRTQDDLWGDLDAD